MGTIADKLAYLNNTKAAIRSALNSKGAQAGEELPFRDYAGLIQGLGAGGSVGPSDVNFLDFDGSLVAAYSLEELAQLSSIPTAPQHDGLISHGWNRTLEQLKSAGRPADVGAVYTTNDGATRLLLEIQGSRRNVNLALMQSQANGVAIDWGDGSPSETMSGTGAIYPSHEYDGGGSYTVSLLPASTCDLVLGDNSSSNCVMGSILEASSSELAVLRGVRLGQRIVIGEYAFAYCCGLRDISMPMGLAALGDFSFTNCVALHGIVLPASLEQIGEYAFLNCFGLRDVAFNSCNIGRGAFTACCSLRSACLPEGMTEVYDEAFAECDALNRISLPASMNSLGITSFYSCRGLTELTLPDTITEIDVSAFTLCSALHTLDLGSGLLSIGSDAFSSCNALTEVTIPASVTSIGSDAFGYCFGLAACRMLSETPPAIEGDIFSEAPDDFVILVPASSVEAYKAAEGWSDYAGRIMAI